MSINRMSANSSDLLSNITNNKLTFSVGLLLIIAIIMFIVSFSYMAKFAGHADDWNVIKEQISQIFMYTGIGISFLMLALFLFIIQDPTYTMRITLILSTIAVGLSFSSLAVAVISR